MQSNSRTHKSRRRPIMAPRQSTSPHPFPPFHHHSGGRRRVLARALVVIGALLLALLAPQRTGGLTSASASAQAPASVQRASGPATLRGLTPDAVSNGSASYVGSLD